MFKHLKTLLAALALSASFVYAPQALSQASEPAAAASVATAPAAAASEVVEENPYGLKALWAQGDMVAKGTLIIMIIMSMGSWYVIFTKLAEQNKLGKQAKTQQRVTVLNTGLSGPMGRRWQVRVSDPAHFGLMGGDMTAELRVK